MRYLSTIYKKQKKEGRQRAEISQEHLTRLLSFGDGKNIPYFYPNIEAYREWRRTPRPPPGP